MRKFTTVEVINNYKRKGYTIDDRPNAINIFGVRNSDTEADTFDDAVGLLWRDKTGLWIIAQYDATTDPGLYYRLNPINKEGSAIICPGQHKACYKVGQHKGYEAMQQIGPMDYVRDNNKNGVLDFLYKVAGAKHYREIAATNIHHAGQGKSLRNYNWSAGCQVIADINDFTKFMNIVKGHVYDNRFDYTLFEIEDFNASNS